MNFWNDRSVLITGIDGFVGSHLAKELVNKHANVIGITRHKKAGYRSYMSLFNLKDNIQTIYGDIRDYHLLTDILSSYEVEYVFHLAAQSIVRSSASSPFDALDNNIRGTYTLLDACKSLKTIKGIAIASSDKAYGAHNDLPYVEDSPFNAKNIYDCSKACTDQLALAYAHNFGLPLTVMRSCNVVGFDLNLTRLIPRTIISLIRGEHPVIFSDVLDYTREFIYSDDVVNAYVTLVERIDKTKGKAYNVASGNIISIKDAVLKICASMKSDISYKIIEKNNPDFKEIPHQYLSGKRIEQDIGWKARVGMDEMISKTIEDFLHYKPLILRDKINID